MTGVFKLSFITTLFVIAAALFSTSVQSAPGLKVPASEVAEGETIQIDASSGSPKIPVFAKDWNISQEFSLISAGNTGVKIKALTPGIGTVSANVNQQALSIKIKVMAAKPAPAGTAKPIATMAPAQSTITMVSAQKLSPCQQDMGDRKREVSQDINEGRYDAARTKLVALKKALQEDSRWADAMLGAIEKLVPEANLPATH
jgi:molecular chaperone DnaK (HSP70)